MIMKRSNGGFTLVEFVVTIAVASMITLAATTMLLLGLRIHHTGNSTAATLNTVSMLYSVMDTIASESSITCTPASDPANPAWSVKAGTTEIKYDGTNITLNGTAFINNVKSSSVSFDSQNLLTINIKTEQNNDYSFSIYCRKGADGAG